MSRIPPLPSIQEIIRLYKLSARKQLSQNFLLDQNITRKIVRKASKKLEGCHVCEVGPGPGSISRSIMEAEPEQLYLIEKDQRFIPGLQMLSQAYNNKVRIFHGDVMTFDMSNLFPRELEVPWDSTPPNIHIIGNLPFNVSTPLIVRFLKQISEHSGAWSYGRTRLTLTFQEEVGERMTANRNHKQRSRLSIMTQYLCRVKHEFSIPGKAFVPAPKVDVAVVTLGPLKRPQIDVPFQFVEKVVRHIFHHRQKYCMAGIQTLFPPSEKHLATTMVDLAEVSPESRSYELSMEEWRRLCFAYKVICDEKPLLLDYNYRSQESAMELKMSS